MFGAPRRRLGERAIAVLLAAAAATSVLVTIGIIVSLTGETLAFFADRAVKVGQFLTGPEWSPLFADPQFGIRPLVQGTLIITLIAMVVAVPLGIGTAAYLSEYASPRVRKAVKPTLELLAGVPTVVFGYFALTFFTPKILNDILGLDVAVFNGQGNGFNGFALQRAELSGHVF